MKLDIPQEVDDEPNLTPMIDVVFLLIVFFMTVTNILSQEKIQMEIPIAPESIIPEDPGIRQTISINREGQFYFGINQVADAAALTPLIKGEVGKYPQLKVFLRADQQTPHEHVRDAMAATAAAGVFDVVFATYQSDK